MAQFLNRKTKRRLFRTAWWIQHVQKGVLTPSCFFGLTHVCMGGLPQKQEHTMVRAPRPTSAPVAQTSGLPWPQKCQPFLTHTLSRNQNLVLKLSTQNHNIHFPGFGSHDLILFYPTTPSELRQQGSSRSLVSVSPRTLKFEGSESWC